jgi:hypothetical protein
MLTLRFSASPFHIFISLRHYLAISPPPPDTIYAGHYITPFVEG